MVTWNGTALLCKECIERFTFPDKMCCLQEKITQLTIDEELANDPETAKEIDKEISEGNFLP